MRSINFIELSITCFSWSFPIDFMLALTFALFSLIRLILNFGRWAVINFDSIWLVVLSVTSGVNLQFDSKVILPVLLISILFSFWLLQ